MENFVLKVAVNSPLRRSFDYLPPDSYGPSGYQDIRPGQRARVPFGKRELVGFITGTSADSEIDPEKLKAAIEILDAEPVLDEELMQLYLWAGNYYHFPIGQALQTSLPKKIRQGGKLSVKADKDSDEPSNKKEAGSEQAHVLNNEQEDAVRQVLDRQDLFHCFLLEGVTGSGKTEVYLQLIEHFLASGKQVLVLVPEISLTPQTIRRFRQRFNREIVSLHSGLSDRQRLQAWLQARNGTADIVIGTRSAVFTPLARAGLIIVDEEHDASYKQQEGFRYSARDLAIFRARSLNLPVVLGSATPSLESLQNALSSRYTHLILKKRAADAGQPVFKCIDLRGRQLSEGFSEELLEAVRVHLERNRQVLVFLNRRGFAPLLQCHDCGWTASCERCDTTFTLHQTRPELRCHHCDAQRPLMTSCPSCGSSALIPIGLGTERVERKLSENFPDIPVYRIDRDTTRNRKMMETTMDNVKSGKPCILTGTQMLAKGHHFPGVTLAAILNADSGLFSSDFRGQEFMGQLITQVAGRSGRGEHAGEVLIQTHHSTHPELNALIRDGYAKFARRLLQEREQAGLPPFSHFVLFRAEAGRRLLPEDFLQKLKTQARQFHFEKVSLIGPMSAPMEKKAGRFRFQLLLRADKRAELHSLTEKLIAYIENLGEARKVRWSVDIDPIDFT